jgi:hypothetical protein
MWLAFICILLPLQSVCIYLYFKLMKICCDVCKWHCLETRNSLYPVDKSGDSLEASVGYYPVAQCRHIDVNSRVLRKATSQSPRINSNLSLTGNQRTTVITLKWKVGAVKYVTTVALFTLQGIEDQNRFRGLTAAEKQIITKTKQHLCLLMCGSLLRDWSGL